MYLCHAETDDIQNAPEKTRKRKLLKNVAVKREQKLGGMYVHTELKQCLMYCIYLIYVQVLEERKNYPRVCFHDPIVLVGSIVLLIYEASVPFVCQKYPSTIIFI